MPTWNEFLQGFGLKELLWTLFIGCFIFAARENFFRKGKKQ
ncbi:MAG: hypothetical protein Q8P84_07210 [Deltaproteobacteria bacterium]|nr:hypothetical protein [Deltaproteobacteria bacterium]